MKKNWDVRKAADTLGIKLIPFDAPSLEGQADGYSTPDSEMAIHHEARHPVFVALHEMGHITLGHTISPYGGTTQKFTLLDLMWKEQNMPRHELEAQIVALEAAFMLGLEPGIEIDVKYETGYLEHFVEPAGWPTNERVAELREAAHKIVGAGLR